MKITYELIVIVKEDDGEVRSVDHILGESIASLLSQLGLVIESITKKFSFLKNELS